MLFATLREAGKKIWKPQSIRLVRHKSSYEGEGKTTVRILNQEPDLGLIIDGYSNFGFRLNNGVTVLGPMAIFPRTILSWQVRNSDDITEPSLRLFKLIVPKIDLLVLADLQAPMKLIETPLRAPSQVDLSKINDESIKIIPSMDESHIEIIGLETGDRKAVDSVFKASRQAKLNVEILPTEHACSTFNFLNAEGRSIAGALIPPLHVTNINEDDMRHSALNYNDPFKKEFTM